MAKRIIITVTNDLVTDQRVNRVANTLINEGYEITLVGRMLPSSTKLSINCKVKRFKLWFNSGALFYANYNIRLFLYLMFNRYNIVLANDLDTLFAAYLASKVKRKQVVYDSHEYFTEVPELIGRKFQQNAWRSIEKWIVPKLKYTYTVCDSIADKYNLMYSSNFKVIRNLPTKKRMDKLQDKEKVKTVIYQGALNVGRGIELMIQSMQYVENTQLWLVGAGDVELELKQLTQNLNLEDKVKFLGRIPLNELHVITAKAHLGLSLEEDRGLNYRFALPNKIFDYLQAGIPILVADLPEMRKIADHYQVGEILKQRSAENLAKKIDAMLSNDEKLVNWQKNIDVAKNELVWEKESQKLIALFNEI